MFISMQAAFMRTLQTRRAEICERWETLLRIERVNTPLANPDTLVFLFDQTLAEVFTARSAPPQFVRVECPCGRNPLLAYFLAGEQALLEALILAQAETPALDPAERDAGVVELRNIVRSIARREIEAFSGICLYRQSAQGGLCPGGACWSHQSLGSKDK